MNKKKLILISLLLFLMSVCTFGQDLNKLKFENAINLTNVSLGDGLALLSNATGTNIVSSGDTESMRISVYANKGSSLKQVLGMIEKSNGLTQVNLKDSILLIKEDKSLGNILGISYDGNSKPLDGVTVELLNSDYSRVLSTTDGIFILSNLKRGIYIMKATKPGYKTKSSIIRVGTGENALKEITLVAGENSKKEAPKRRVDTLDLGSLDTDDKPGHTEVEKVKLMYTSTPKAAAVLKGLFQGNQLIIKESPAEQVIILNGTSDTIEIAKKILNEVDNPIRQVRITAQIIETTNNLFEDLGFKWLVGDKSSGASRSKSADLLSADPSATALKFVNIFNSSKSMLDLSIHLLQTTNDLKVSSVPSVTVVNGEPAVFKVTQEVNAGLKVDTNGESGNSTEEPIFKEAGTKFDVTPIIRRNADGNYIVNLKVDSEISSFKEDPLDKSNYKVPLRLKDQTNITTNIELKDGATVFIGGLKTKKVNHTVKKVPILGSIPYLGALFRSTEDENEVKQVYIEIKAEVIQNDDPSKEFNLDGFKESPLTDGEISRIYPAMGDRVIDAK